MEHFAISQGVLSAVQQLFIPFVLRFFFVFGIIAFAVGAGLIVNRARMLQFFGVMNRWVSTRSSTKWLAVPRDLGPVVLRYRRLIGALFVLLAAYSTFILMTQVDIGKLVLALNVAAPPAFVAWLAEAVRLFLVLGGGVAIAVGLMLAFAPHTLQAIEVHADHWYSLRRYSQRLDAMHLWLDQRVESYPTAAGWLIAIPALFVVVDYGLLLYAAA